MKHLCGLLFVLAFIILSGCGLETKTLLQFHDEDLSDITKIVIFDGNTGYQKTIENIAIIDHFLDDIKDIKFIPEENQEPRDGFNYSITLYQNGEETFQFGLTQVKNDYYDTQPDIFPIVDEFYKNLKVKEE